MTDYIKVRTLAPIVHKGKVIHPAGKIIRVLPASDGKNYFAQIEHRGMIVIRAAQVQKVEMTK